MSHAIALPRARTRRRRRKPMPPSLRLWLFLLVVNLVGVGMGIVQLLGGEVPFALPINVIASWIAWNIVVREWKAWKDGDE